MLATPPAPTPPQGKPKNAPSSLPAPQFVQEDFQGGFTDTVSPHFLQKPSENLCQGFLTPALLTFWALNAVGSCLVCCRMFSSTPVLLDARSIPDCDNQKRLQMLPNVPRGGVQKDIGPLRTPAMNPEALQLLN